MEKCVCSSAPDESYLVVKDCFANVLTHIIPMILNHCVADEERGGCRGTRQLLIVQHSGGDLFLSDKKLNCIQFLDLKIVALVGIVRCTKFNFQVILKVNDWIDAKFEKYAIEDREDQWSPGYITDRDKFLSSLNGSPVSSVKRWKFYILRVERRLRYSGAKHQPFKKFSGAEIVTLQALRSTLIGLRTNNIQELYTKTALINSVSASTLVSTGTARTWVEALLQRRVLQEVINPAIVADKRKKYLYASAATRVEFYKDCILEMLNHISGVEDLFGQGSIQIQREIDLFTGYEII